MTAGSATNQGAAETTPSADQNAKEEAAENTPAAESDEPSGETVAERRNVKEEKTEGASVEESPATTTGGGSRVPTEGSDLCKAGGG